MGGGSSASSSASQATSIISEVITTNMTNHSSIVHQNQDMRVRGNYNIVADVTMNQGYEININEATSSDQIAGMQIDITAQLQQKASAESVAFLDVLGGSESEINANIETEIRSLISTENITNIAVQVNQSQGIDISGSYNIVSNISFNQLGTIIDENVRNLTQTNNLIAKMDTILNQSAKAKSTNPLDAIVDAIRAIGDSVGKVLGIGALGLWAPVLLIIMIIGLGYLFSGGGNGVTSPMLAPAMRPIPMQRMMRPPSQPIQMSPVVAPAAIVTPEGTT